MNEPIYHLAIRRWWDAAVEQQAPYRRSTVDSSLDDEGFIHCSFRDQVQGVADRFYRGLTDIVLLTVDRSKLNADVRTENGYPHIYGPLPVEAVANVQTVECGDDGRLLVSGLLG